MAQIHGIQAIARAITCRQGHHLLAELPYNERYRGNMPADQAHRQQQHAAQALSLIHISEPTRPY